MSEDVTSSTQLVAVYRSLLRILGAA